MSIFPHLQSISFVWDFPTEKLRAFLLSLCMLHIRPTHFFLILHFNNIRWRMHSLFSLNFTNSMSCRTAIFNFLQSQHQLGGHANLVERTLHPLNGMIRIPRTMVKSKFLLALFSSVNITSIFRLYEIYYLIFRLLKEISNKRCRISVMIACNAASKFTFLASKLNVTTNFIFFRT
jgi:hypothetical protein